MTLRSWHHRLFPSASLNPRLSSTFCSLPRSLAASKYHSSTHLFTSLLIHPLLHRLFPLFLCLTLPSPFPNSPTLFSAYRINAFLHYPLRPLRPPAHHSTTPSTTLPTPLSSPLHPLHPYYPSLYPYLPFIFSPPPFLPSSHPNPPPHLKPTPNRSLPQAKIPSPDTQNPNLLIIPPSAQPAPHLNHISTPNISHEYDRAVVVL